jgi:hypothetical protein
MPEDVLDLEEYAMEWWLHEIVQEVAAGLESYSVEPWLHEILVERNLDVFAEENSERMASH